mmetsp:Transcript_13027/g.27744  ORF Transcript_13027/g.27744 Transcript_13027/m.27744 type:complete len:204 (+) Transcript_13027:596-1207(+)
MSNVSKLTFSPCRISTMVLLNPQRGASREPFMKRTTGAECVSACSRALSPPARAAAGTASASSPSSRISRTMSRPPRSLPSAYSCGKVGQFENSLSPCRTSSSVRMSKVSNWIFSSCRISTICRLKPHRGASADPFMKSMTGDLRVSALSRACRDCFCEGIAGTVASPWMAAVSAFCFTLSVSSGAFAPITASVTLPSWRKRK